ncbi:MAG: Ig-like domain-containing protein, partial [Clostridiales bacterium]|nr:Ig-like domain-containing protein [Clostridiales bacterium]
MKQTEEASQSESVSQSDPLQSETVKQTEAPASVVRGTDYEISGDSNAWYRDENGMLWVRAGTSLYVQPKSGSGYNTGMSLANLQSDGVFTFTLSKKKKDNTVVKESASGQESYYVDWEAPSARFTISGNSKDAIHYASQSCSVSVAVEPDGKSGLKSTAYKIIPCDAGGSVAKSVEGVAWTECVSNAALQISEEGLFRIYIKTEDMVGNIAFSSSDVICVDNTQPEITVTGADNQTANAGSVSLKVRCSDNHYKAGSMQVTITGVNQGNIPAVRQEGSDEMGAWVEYHDFPQMQSYDDVYELSVTAEDLSGNTSEKTICFSVNRFGSVYDLSSETKKLLEQYFIPEAGDVVFYETNIDYVGESRIYCRHDGVLRELTDGTDYQVTMEGSETSWKRYRYTVPASYFSQEGVYELLLASGDAAENTSDTGVQQKRVTFVLDWTSPSCMVSGVEDGGVYDEESVMLCVVPYDNIGLSCLRIYRNSELFLENAGQPVSGEAVKLSLESDSEWQTLQIWLIDMAGNEYWSEEMPVFVGAAGIDVPVY